jgi:hypothetical protein
MCGDATCPLKACCYRNPASGTEPGVRQSFFFTKKLWSKRKLKNGEAIKCPYYWRAPEKSVASLPPLNVDLAPLEERN